MGEAEKEENRAWEAELPPSHLHPHPPHFPPGHNFQLPNRQYPSYLGSAFAHDAAWNPLSSLVSGEHCESQLHPMTSHYLFTTGVKNATWAGHDLQGPSFQPLS